MYCKEIYKVEQLPTKLSRLGKYRLLPWNALSAFQFKVSVLKYIQMLNRFTKLSISESNISSKNYETRYKI